MQAPVLPWKNGLYGAPRCASIGAASREKKGGGAMRTDKLFLAATLACSASAFDALAQNSEEGYVRSVPAGVFVKSPFGMCVRTGYWTPAMANSECDPDLVPKPAAAPVPSR